MQLKTSLMNDFIIWGATGQAIVLEELLRSQDCKILAFFENNFEIKSPFENIPIFYGKKGFEDWIKEKKSVKQINYLVAIGGNKGKERETIFKYLKNQNIKPKTVIHNTAFVAYNSIIDDGCQILAQSSICSKAKLGKSVIINTAASIDHETIIEDFVHVAPGARLCGCVKVGKHCFIGANATVLPHITIGNSSIIGAGSVITKNVPPFSVIVGNPGREIKYKDAPIRKF